FKVSLGIRVLRMQHKKSLVFKCRINNYICPVIAGVATLLAGGTASAQSAAESKQPLISHEPSGIVGHLGIGNGLNFAREVDGGNNDSADVWFYTIDGSITVPFADSWLVSLGGYYRYDDFSSHSDFDDNEDPEWEYMLGLHLLKQFTPDTRAGVFVGYGDTRPQDGDRGDSYDVIMYGAEVHHFFTDNLMLYAQLGWGEKVRDGQDQSEGFKGGMFGRVGAMYFMSERSTVTLDVEAAGTRSYIDGDDPGRFFGFTANYQYQLWDSAPLYFNCFGRWDHISSTDEDDVIEEWQLGFGFKYIFGAGSQLNAARKGANIGLPRLPTRASAWTEYLD
ncbi:MAG: hypothetical protein ACNA8L_06755, partial [Luteolibacter sp.]